MEQQFVEETERLKAAWDNRDAATLRDYLVQDVEDPRINAQSILARHFLIRRLFGDKYAALEEQELRFAIVVHWLRKTSERIEGAAQLGKMLDALLDGASEANGERIPEYVIETFDLLPAEIGPAMIPDYVSDGLIQSQIDIDDEPVADNVLWTFGRIWRQFMDRENAGRISVVEPACGSANDYRFWDAYGVARFIDYCGFDLCRKNIANAREMFPDVRFEAGNVFEIASEDNEFDCCVVNDLFEHLSVAAMERAIQEISRVTRNAICAGFFNMGRGVDHDVRPRNGYHWNRLSVDRTRALFEDAGGEVEIVHIHELLNAHFGFSEIQNKGAYTFVVRL